MRIESKRYDFNDVLIRPKRSTLESRGEVSLVRSFKMKWSPHVLTCVPIMAANMDTIGTIAMARELSRHKLVTVLHKYVSVEEVVALADEDPVAFQSFVCLSIGKNQDELKSVIPLIERTRARMLCLDVANGYIEAFETFVRQVRAALPDIILLAGNVATAEMAEALVLAGADIIKVGIGPGSVCTTRRMTGVGYPQLSAIMECGDAAHGLKGHIIGDGGCVEPGDVCKAFAGGTDFVMLGGMLSGHDECAGERKTIRGKTYLEFYGMSSERAMMIHMGEVAQYRAAEGRRVRVRCRGPVRETVYQVLGGVRSMCSYIGAENIKEVPKRATLVLTTPPPRRQLNAEEVDDEVDDDVDDVDDEIGMTRITRVVHASPVP